MNEHIPNVRLAEQMLSSPQGATMDEIIAATGGPQYNLLRRLEARGYAIRKVKEGRATRYFATPPERSPPEAVVTSKGQVTIPKGIRDHLRLGRGQKIRFSVEDDGRVVITAAYKRLADLAGMLGKPSRSVTIEEMDEGIKRAATERYLRAVGRR